MGHNKGEFSSLQGTEGSDSSLPALGFHGFSRTMDIPGYRTLKFPRARWDYRCLRAGEGWEVAGTSAWCCAVTGHRWAVSGRVQSHIPCSAALLPGLGSEEGHLEREQQPGAVRGVKGSSGGTERGGSGGAGLGLCRVRIKLSPGTQQGWLGGPCRCSAVAAGDTAALPPRVSRARGGVRNLRAPEGRGRAAAAAQGEGKAPLRGRAAGSRELE